MVGLKRKENGRISIFKNKSERRKEIKSKEQQPGSVIEAIVRKESDKVKYGIVFHRSQPKCPTTIKLIRSEGLFHSKGLQPEMYLLEVNGEEATWRSPKELASLLRDAPVGSDVSVKATLPKTIRVERNSDDASWGFSIKNSTTREGIYVDHVAPDGLAASAGLEHGMLLLKINGGESFPNNLKETAKELRAQWNSLELMVVQLEVAVDTDVDAPAAGKSAIAMEEAREEIEMNHPTYEALFIENTETEIRDEMNVSTFVNNEIETRDELTNMISPALTMGSQDEVLDLDDLTCFDTNSQAPDEDREKKPRVSRELPRKATGKDQSASSKPSSRNWLFSKEEDCFDLDDQFPEKDTENNNSLSRSIFPAPKRTGVMSHVMQLRKIRKSVPKNPIVTIGQTNYAPNTDALIFGQKTQLSLTTVDKYDPQKKRPRFFKGKTSKKSKEDKKKKEEGEEKKGDDVFDWLFSLQDLICTTLFPEPQDVPARDDIMSITSATSRRSVLMRPVRFRKRRTAAEIILRDEEILEL